MPTRTFRPTAKPDIQRPSTPVQARPIMAPPPPKAQPVMQRPAAPPQRVAASPAPQPTGVPGGVQNIRPGFGVISGGGNPQPPDVRPPIPTPPPPVMPIGGTPYRTPPPFDTSYFQNQMVANPNLSPEVMAALQQLQGVYGQGGFYDVNGSQQGWQGSGASMPPQQFRPSAYVMGGQYQQPGRPPTTFSPTYRPPQPPSMIAGAGRTPAFTPSIGNVVQPNPYRG